MQYILPRSMLWLGKRLSLPDSNRSITTMVFHSSKSWRWFWFFWHWSGRPCLQFGRWTSYRDAWTRVDLTNAGTRYPRCKLGLFACQGPQHRPGNTAPTITVSMGQVEVVLMILWGIATNSVTPPCYTLSLIMLRLLD
jgi:hypothetical protein